MGHPIQAKRKVEHPSHSLGTPWHINDLTLLELSREIDLTTTPDVNAACWPSSDQAPGNEIVSQLLVLFDEVFNLFWSFSKALISGWGRTSNSYPATYSDTLQYVSKFNFQVNSIIWNSFIQAVVSILPRSRCRQTWGDIWHENHICIADEDGASPCNADSGGPIAVQESDSIVLFRIVTRAETCFKFCPLISIG